MSLISAVIEIKKVRTHQDTTLFTVATANFIKYEGAYAESKEPTIIGHFPTIYEGDQFQVKGYWERHHIYGFNYIIQEAKRILPRTERTIIDFFVNHVEGVGKKTAQQIVKTLGLSAISIIYKEPKKLLEVRGIGEEKARNIHDTISKHLEYEKITAFVLSNGGSYKTVSWVYKEYGNMAIQKIRENPYLLIELPNEDMTTIELFEMAERVALNLQFNVDSLERIEAIIKTLFRLIVESKGDVYIREAELKNELLPFLHKYSQVFMDQMSLQSFLDKFDTAVDNLINKKEFVKEIDEENETIFYLARYLYYENRIIENVKRIMQSRSQALVPQEKIESWIDDYEKNSGMVLDIIQKEAIFKGLQAGISILTGGPGTGKTQTLSAILQCLREHSPSKEVALFAPTGRAAKRMTELTNIPSKTIHRGVGIGTPFGNSSPLTADYIVVDEMSMTDIYVMHRLLDKVPNGSSLLLVGDVDQLPSVGPGLILRNFIDSEKFPTARLQKFYRQSENSYVTANAHMINKGYQIGKGIEVTNQNTDFYLIHKSDEEEIENMIIRVVERFLDIGYNLEDIKVLSPLNIGTLGTWRLNNLLQEKFNPMVAGHTREYLLDDTVSLRVNDFVLQNKNNGELKVTNGDIGIVRSIYDDLDKGLVIQVEYDTHDVIYDRNTAEELSLAYATTIHKSQGSEYPIVIMPFSEQLKEYYNRNLIYTGWTRTQSILVNIGTPDAINYGIQKVEQSRRNSMIKEKLQSTQL